MGFSTIWDKKAELWVAYFWASLITKGLNEQIDAHWLFLTLKVLSIRSLYYWTDGWHAFYVKVLTAEKKLHTSARDC